MDQRLNFVTLAVADPAAARRFYVDGLRWRVEFEAPGDVLFLRVGPGTVLSLWDRGGFTEEVGTPSTGLAPMTLAHNVSSAAEVDRVLDDARAAGALEVSLGQRRDWGGYSGYFADPDGFRWEVAHNPTPLGDELVARSREWERAAVEGAEPAARSGGTAGEGSGGSAGSDGPACADHSDAGADPSAEEAAAELRAREPLFHREPRDATREHIERMTAPGLVHIGASGRRLGRDAVVEEVTRRYAEGDHGDDASWIVEDFAVERLAPGLYAATYVLHQGTRVTQRVTLWERSDGRWRVRRHQGTVVSD